MLQAKSLYQRSAKAKRKARRKEYLSCYKLLKRGIKREAKKGNTKKSYRGSDESLAVAARLLYRKSEGIRIHICMREKKHGFGWNTPDVTIKWAKNVVPDLIMKYITRDEDDDEEEY